MPHLRPFRERTPAQFREQARRHRESAKAATGQERMMHLRLAERYETMANLKDADAFQSAGERMVC